MMLVKLLSLPVVEVTEMAWAAQILEKQVPLCSDPGSEPPS